MITDAIDNISNWEFLQEPLYRWAIFLIALSLFAFVWHGIIEFIK